MYRRVAVRAGLIGAVCTVLVPACGGHNGLEIDVSGANGAQTVTALVVDDTCTIGTKQCTDPTIGPSVSLDGSAAVPGAMYEIGSAVSADVHDGKATFLIETGNMPLPYNLWRVVLLAFGDSPTPQAAYVLEQVHITNARQQVAIDLSASDANIEVYAMDALGGPYPCLGVTVDNAREYYLPANNHDCDGYAATSDAECDDLFANYKSPQGDLCFVDGSASTLPASCVAGARTCDDGTGATCVVPKGYGSGTECFPMGLCTSHCTDLACLAPTLSQLGSGMGIDCTLLIDPQSGDVCGAAGATSYSFSFSGCTSESVALAPALGSAIATVVGGGYQVPVSTSMSSASECVLTFGAGAMLGSGSGSGSAYVVEETLSSNNVVLELPLTLTITPTASAGCTLNSSSSCTLTSLSGSYGACIGP